MEVKVNNVLLEDTDYIIEDNKLTPINKISKGDRVSMSYECTRGLNRKQRRDIEFGRK